MAPEAKAAPAKQMVGLPLLVAGPVDVGRLLREVETIDDGLRQAELRGGEVKLPRIGKLLDQTITINKLNLLEAADRKTLIDFLNEVKRKAPLLHISFGAEPSEAFLEKLMAWLRKEINPLVLLTIGLQPTIGAGCIVRSTNKQFDFSLRQDFLNKRDMLLTMLVAQEAPAPAPVAAPAQPEAVKA